MPIGRSDIWRHAKPILLPYEGMASQIYVLDIPSRELGAVIDVFASSVSEPAVITLDDQTDDPRPLTAELRQALLSHTRDSTSHQLRGLRAGCQSLSMFLWLDAHAVTFDAELVFWSDQLFPQPDDDLACRHTFEEYLDLADALRALSPSSECVLSARETGDPRDDREEAWTCWW
jgi:hypothetical protein